MICVFFFSLEINFIKPKKINQNYKSFESFYKFNHFQKDVKRCRLCDVELCEF